MHMQQNRGIHTISHRIPELAMQQNVAYTPVHHRTESWQCSRMRHTHHHRTESWQCSRMRHTHHHHRTESWQCSRMRHRHHHMNRELAMQQNEAYTPSQNREMAMQQNEACTPSVIDTQDKDMLIERNAAYQTVLCPQIDEEDYEVV